MIELLVTFTFTCSSTNSWLDPLLWQGWRRTLKQEDLYVHPQETDSEALLRKFNKYIPSLVDFM